MASARDTLGQAFADDLQPLRDALAEALKGDDAGLLDRARTLHKALPKLATEIIAAKHSAAALYRILSTAMAEGLAAPTNPKPEA